MIEQWRISTWKIGLKIAASDSACGAIATVAPKSTFSRPEFIDPTPVRAYLYSQCEMRPGEGH